MAVWCSVLESNQAGPPGTPGLQPGRGPSPSNATCGTRSVSRTLHGCFVGAACAQRLGQIGDPTGTRTRRLQHRQYCVTPGVGPELAAGVGIEPTSLALTAPRIALMLTGKIRLVHRVRFELTPRCLEGRHAKPLTPAVHTKSARQDLRTARGLGGLPAQNEIVAHC